MYDLVCLFEFENLDSKFTLHWLYVPLSLSDVKIDS